MTRKRRSSFRGGDRRNRLMARGRRAFRFDDPSRTEYFMSAGWKNPKRICISLRGNNRQLCRGICRADDEGRARSRCDLPLLTWAPAVDLFLSLSPLQRVSAMIIFHQPAINTSQHLCVVSDTHRLGWISQTVTSRRVTHDFPSIPHRRQRQ